MGKRFVFVVELLTPTPIGHGSKAREHIGHYLLSLSKILSQKPIYQPKTHLSQKYGLAAWLPLTNGSAIHLYAWDDRSPSFISVDIASSSPINEKLVREYTQKHFGVSAQQCLMSRSIGPKPPNWKNLADDIIRQRLMLYSEDCPLPRFQQIVDFLPKLSTEIEMIPLYSVYANRRTAWMHWETSGGVLFWQDGCLSLDIYTCKYFSIKGASDYTAHFFGLKNLRSHPY